MREASLWLSAYVGVYAQTLAGRKELILFIFRRDGTTCGMHMPYVVAYVAPDVEGDNESAASARTHQMCIATSSFIYCSLSRCACKNP
jgi:hypothetical protein